LLVLFSNNFVVSVNPKIILETNPMAKFYNVQTENFVDDNNHNRTIVIFAEC